MDRPKAVRSPSESTKIALKQYETEWSNICSLLQSHKLSVLRRVAVEGNLRSSNFRSLHWTLFLGILSGSEPQNWAQQRAEQRCQYDKLRQKFRRNPQSVENSEDDPLSQAESSAWNQHFCDEELLSVIQQDVVRTFPGVEFFRKPGVQTMMIDVLFIYARQFPQMVYRQGMHEVLAPIIFVIQSDLQALNHVKELGGPQSREIMELLSTEWLEADAYEIFARIMIGLEQYYKVNDLIPTSSGHFPANSDPNDGLRVPSILVEKQKLSELEVIKQLNTIKDKILAKEDLHLHNHLLKLEIPLSLFGIRWLRLLFGREFPLQDLLLVWDAIFAENDDFSLVKYLTVAMLVRIRDKLLYSDYTTTLTHLMKFPSNSDVGLIIRHALHMKSPKTYQRPPNAINFNIRPKSEPPRVPPPVLKPRRPPPPTRQSTSRNVNRIQNVTALAALSSAHQHRVSSDLDDFEIIDGYAEDVRDPEVLRQELHYHINLTALARTKLLQYLAVFRRHIPSEEAPMDLANALDGIEEICSLLKPRQETIYAVERAAEAADDSPSSPPPLQIATLPVDIPPIVIEPKTAEPPPPPKTRIDPSILFGKREVEMKEMRRKVDDDQRGKNDVPKANPALIE